VFLHSELQCCKMFLIHFVSALLTLILCCKCVSADPVAVACTSSFAWHSFMQQMPKTMEQTSCKISPRWMNHGPNHLSNDSDLVNDAMLMMLWIGRRGPEVRAVPLNLFACFALLFQLRYFTTQCEFFSG